MDKKLVAQMLEEVGHFLELKGENPFKVRAYYNAARTIDGFVEDLNQLVKEERLCEIPSIGKGLEEKIVEIVKTGQLTYLLELRKGFPPGLPALLCIPGLGCKKVKVLYDRLNISSIGELEYACKENRLLEIPGFGAKSQENILKGIEYTRKNQGSYLFDKAFENSQALLKEVKKMPGILRAEVAGSVRRCKEIIHDIDIVASAESGVEKIMDRFTRLPGVEEVIAKGETKSSVRLSSGIQVDLRVVGDREYPYALLYFTGSKEHNTMLRGIAKDKGLKLNEYGLFRGEKAVPCKDEAGIYKALGMEYIPPELREGGEEITVAEEDRIPTLVKEDDLQGIFHVHSTWSDGTADIETMARAAQKMGYKYMGLSDHSQTAMYAGGLSVANVKKQQVEIDALNRKLKGFRIFKGIESDILADGSLDYPEKVLEKFDFVIASIHSGFKMDEEQMTKRLVKALENPHTTMLGHMTGRLLLARDGYRLKMDRIIETAARYKKVIEINSNPQRFDMDWRYLRKAAEKGVRFSINPDAHSPEGLRDTSYGVGIARKGWLTKKDVVNTMALGEMEKFLARG